MDTARNRKTLEHVDAEDLWHTKSVDQNGYICVGCRLKATPCSYDRKVNKKRPYFRFDNPNNHEEGCFYEQNTRLVKEAKKKKISTIEGFPLSHPSVLSLDDERTVEESEGTMSPSGGSRRKSSGNGSPSQTDRKHNYSVRTINSIAKHYLKFPYDRRDMPLEISGIEGNNYNEVIKQLPDEIVIFRANKLRVGRLNNFAKPEIENLKISIQLLSGCWLNKKPHHTYKVVTDTTGWNEGKKDYIVNSVLASQDEYKDNKRKGTFVFFVGQQDEVNPNEFFVRDYRLFTCISY